MTLFCLMNLIMLWTSSLLTSPREIREHFLQVQVRAATWPSRVPCSSRRAPHSDPTSRLPRTQGRRFNRLNLPQGALGCEEVHGRQRNGQEGGGEGGEEEGSTIPAILSQFWQPQKLDRRAVWLINGHDKGSNVTNRSLSINSMVSIEQNPLCPN